MKLSFITLALSIATSVFGENPRNYVHQHRFPIDHETVKLLVPISRYAQISYCLGSFEGIRKPFRCRYGCTQFVKSELLYEWEGSLIFDSPVAGYLVADHRAKQLVLMFRGAHSISDVVHSFMFRQSEYTPWTYLPENKGTTNEFYCNGTFIDPDSGHYVTQGCKIHEGVLQMYKRTMETIDDWVFRAATDPLYKDWRFIIAGHSLGGIIATLVGADFKLRGLDPTVISFGSPKFGNRGFANWYDDLFDTQSHEQILTSSDRRYFRVTKNHDLYTHFPISPWYWHTSGEVYISDDIIDQPDEETVFFCSGQMNSLCSHTSYTGPLSILFNEPIHMHYFTDLHGCALEHSYVPIRDVNPPYSLDDPYSNSINWGTSS